MIISLEWTLPFHSDNRNHHSCLVSSVCPRDTGIQMLDNSYLSTGNYCVDLHVRPQTGRLAGWRAAGEIPEYTRIVINYSPFHLACLVFSVGWLVECSGKHSILVIAFCIHLNSARARAGVFMEYSWGSREITVGIPGIDSWVSWSSQDEESQLKLLNLPEANQILIKMRPSQVLQTYFPEFISQITRFCLHFPSVFH